MSSICWSRDSIAPRTLPDSELLLASPVTSSREPSSWRSRMTSSGIGGSNSRAVSILVDRQDEFADVIVRETGKPRIDVLGGEILGACDAMTDYAKRARRILADCNDCMVGCGATEMPFGGVKDSGIGRVNGDAELLSHTVDCHRSLRRPKRGDVVSVYTPEAEDGSAHDALVVGDVVGTLVVLRASRGARGAV